MGDSKKMVTGRGHAAFPAVQLGTSGYFSNTDVLVTLLQEIKKHHDNVLVIIEYDFINAVCWDLRVKVF